MKKLSGFEHFEPKRQRVESQSSNGNGVLFNTRKSNSSSSSANAILSLLSSLDTISDSLFVVGAADDENNGPETALTSVITIADSIQECTSTLATSLPFCCSLVIDSPKLVNIQQLFAALSDIGKHITWTSKFSFPTQQQRSSAELQQLQTSLFHLLNRSVGLHSFCIQGANSLPSAVFHTDIASSRSCILSGLTQNDLYESLHDLAATYYIVDNVENGESSSLTNASVSAVFRRRKRGKSILLTGENSWRIGVHIILDTVRSKLISTSSNNKNVPSCTIIANQTFPFALINTPLVETLSFERKINENENTSSTSSLSWLIGTSNSSNTRTSTAPKSTVRHTVRVSGFLNHFLITKLITVLHKDGEEYFNGRVFDGLSFLHPQSAHRQRKKKLVPLRSASLELQTVISSSSSSMRQPQRGGTQSLINPFAVVIDAPRQALAAVAAIQASATPPQAQGKLVMRFEGLEAPFKDIAAILQITEQRPELFIEDQVSDEHEIQFSIQTTEQLAFIHADGEGDKVKFELAKKKSSFRLAKPSLHTQGKEDEDGLTLDPMKKYDTFVDNSIF